MIPERKLFYAIWYMRVVLLFGILGFLFAGYVSGFANSDIMKASILVTVSLINAMLFFSTFPGHRLDVRFKQLKRKLCETFDYADSLPAVVSMQSDAHHFAKFALAYTILIVFMIVVFP